MIPLPALSLKEWLRLGATIAGAALGIWAWRIDGLRADHLAGLNQCRSEKSEQAEQFRRAQQAALDIANAAKARKEAEYDAARREADARYDDLGGKYRALVLRKAAADRRAAGGAGLPGTAPAAQGADRAGENPGVPAGGAAIATFVISDADALICAENTARLEAARAWAIRTQ